MRSKLSALLASTLVAFATLAQAQPTITAQPTSASTASGWNTVTLSVTATASSGTLSYQWRKDGNNLVNTSVSNPPVTTTLPGGRAVDTIISGAMGSALSITNAMVANSGSYTVVVTDSAGSVTSNAVTVTLTDVAPTVVAQSPASASVTAGGRAVLYITVNGSRPLNIQWKKNGVALGGVNGSSSTALELDQFSAAQAGTYTVDVSNAYGTATVQPMALQVAGQNDPFDTW
ncbi:MAG TPA: immunoglobulin domain-containing protein, partial [Acidobacteriota bacterium]|nr:immunoglobulin domain-containing protein [Acidobacteriota bacterium]